MMSGVTREAAKRCVGKGWHGLIDEFYDEFPDAGMTQVKEKYGRLCLYHSNETDQSTDKEINISHRSEMMCEGCGASIEGPKVSESGWVDSLCDTCYENKNKKL